MLVAFTVENWMSFRDPVSFSMLPTIERRFGHTLPYLDSYKKRVLPVAALYGANASGKSNFFAALRFIQKFVLQEGKEGAPIPVVPFRLDPAMADRPSRFSILLLAHEVLYEYAFTVTRRLVVEEKLSKLSVAGATELFSRRGETVTFARELRDDPRLAFVFEGTGANRLFLTNSVSQRMDVFRPVYDWFKDTLTLIAPDAVFHDVELLMNEREPLHQCVSRELARMDTGVARLGGEECAGFLPEKLQKALQKDVEEGRLQEGETAAFWAHDGGRLLATNQGGRLMVSRLVAMHRASDGNEVAFNLTQESDGTRRLIDLLPAFTDVDPVNPNRVYVIDELDRSLHTLLSRKLLEMYIAGCSPATRRQLLFTTHDVLLLDQNLLRRDEMWLAERDRHGVSSLIPVSDYKDVRYDKDLRKSYLSGRLGGIPRFLLQGVPDERNGVGEHP